MKKTGYRTTFYLDAEAHEALKRYTAERYVRPSNVVCGLIRALTECEPRHEDGSVLKDLKRVFGRQSFLAFMQDVRQALPEGFEPAETSLDSDYRPEFWTRGKVGVYAFFAPTKNVERMIGNAFKLKAAHGLEKLVVAALGADEVDVQIVEDLRRAGVFIESLGRLNRVLREL